MQLVMRSMSRPDDDPTAPVPKAVTVRLAPGDYQRLKSYAQAKHISLNTLLNEAITEYGRKIEREETLRRIEAFRSGLAAARGPEEDAVTILHNLRRDRTSSIEGHTR
jgi:predicted transcriptional regulator